VIAALDTWLVTVGGGLAALLIVQYVYLVAVVLWAEQKTRRLGYFGIPAADRGRFRRALRIHSIILGPMLRLLARLSKPGFAKISVRADGLAGPTGSCTERSFLDAFAYEPSDQDVFVVTQMRCGTTWMQHLVYEVLNRGNGDLVDTGTALQAVSPWLESVRGPAVGDAPLLGTDKRWRVIKTHLPAERCPRSATARYVYVTRHPVSCFVSCTDYLRASLGRFAPDAEAVERWFCSDEAMWWGPWPNHVAGWWQRGQGDAHVLFCSFEEMKSDMVGIIRRLETLLGLRPLTGAEVENVRRKTSFEYMQAHAAAFEMMPPSLLSADAKLLVRGSAGRHEEAAPATRRRILRWTAGKLAGSGFLTTGLYPDVTEAGHEPE